MNTATNNEKFLREMMLIKTIRCKIKAQKVMKHLNMDLSVCDQRLREFNLKEFFRSAIFAPEKNRLNSIQKKARSK